MTLATPIVHHPFAFNIGPLSITGFGIAVLMAFLVADVVSERELARRGHDVEARAMGDVLFAAILGTLLGAKLYYVSVITHDVRDLFTRGGFVFWGGFMGAVALCALTIRYKKLSFLRFADVAGIAIAAGYSVGRTGCWAVGDDYGRPWNGFLAVAFPDGAPRSTALNMMREFNVALPPGTDPTSIISVYPTQLFEVVLGFVMFMVLWRMRKHAHAEGWLFGVYCILAGAERFFVEFFRAKDDRLGIGLSVAQLIAIGIVIVGLAIVRWRSASSAAEQPGGRTVGQQA
jgi:phosphatidylglycerol---prolipoprotein diacylglyceryl transferase